jgi:hypothetical protein
MAAVTSFSTLPDACSIAFKEWAGVCDSLGEGRQSLILRKGGVSEGGDGFRPEHPAFWLYPTFVHEAEQGLRTATRPRLIETPGEVAIESLVVVEWVGRVERVEQLAALAAFHDWTEATILGRFRYRTPGLWAMAVRTYRRPEPWPVAITRAHLGCKTWVPLETPPPTSGLVPVLDDEESARRLALIRSAIEPEVEDA